MFKFTDQERKSYELDHSLSSDEDGRDTLIGLTHSETEELVTHMRKFAAGDRDRESRDRCIFLSQKMEPHRLKAVAQAFELSRKPGNLH